MSKFEGWFWTIIILLVMAMIPARIYRFAFLCLMVPAAAVILLLAIV